MSDPVSNAEIEDVLSSIRRLISESKASEGQEASTKTEKLVLTPAFRVHDESNSKPSSPAPQRDRVLELEDPVIGAGTRSRHVDEAAKPITREEKPQEAERLQAEAETPRSSTDDHPIPVFSHRGYSKTPVEDAEELPPLMSEAEQDATTLTGRFAEFEYSANQKPDAWEADEGDETAQSDVLMFHAARLRTDSDEGITDTETRDWPKGEDAPEAPFVAVKDATDAERQPPNELRQNHSAPLVPDAHAGDVEIVGDDTDIIDEEVVQAMVARLVREELQGEVGEKITQSIRRFVRREIERALTLKGLE